MGSKSQAVKIYLAGEPIDQRAKNRGFTAAWFGESTFKNKDTVKLLTSGPDETSATTWCPIRKLWGTHSKPQVVLLIESGLWTPAGIDPGLAHEIKKAIKLELAAEADAKEAAKQAEAAAVAAKQAAVAAEVAARVEARAQADGSRFTLEEIGRAENEFGIPKHVLEMTPRMAFLGPTTPSALTRVARFFLFPHQLKRGCSAVYNDDILPAYAEVVAARDHQKTPGERKREKSPKAKEESRDETIKRMKIAADKRAARRSQTGMGPSCAHAIALAKIVERSQAMGPILAIVRRPCSGCHEVVNEQFLSCSCCDSTSDDFYVCFTCNMVAHKTKSPCFCL